MSRTTSLIGSAGGFPALAADPAVDPSWQQWIDLVGIALRESGDAAWSRSPVLAECPCPAGAPLLDGATVRVDGGRAGALVRLLAERAGIPGEAARDAVGLMRAAIARDDDTIARVAERAIASSSAVAVLAQLAAMPLLIGCARALAHEVPRSWQRGYCPVCGGWPSLVEMRGIERERRLRCGGCGSDWALPVLRCAFCDELDHHRLGSLVLEGEEQRVRVETCESCHGYLKAVTTLGAIPLDVLALQDMSTVPLDMAAQDRGYARPSHPAWRVRVELVA